MTYALILANVAVFVFSLPAYGDPYQQHVFFLNWGLVPAFGGPVNYLTSMFLHAGFMHLAGNMLFLWVFGDNLEDELGHLRFLGFYLLAGIASALAQVAADPASTIPMVGASGAIGGVMGGYLLMFPRARVDVLFIIIIFVRILPVPAWIVLGFWFAAQIFSGVSTPTDMGGVAYWAHAGGFISGLAMVLPVWLARGGPRYWNRTHGTPPHPEAAYRVGRSSIPTIRRRR